jgi:hypothetical protein
MAAHVRENMWFSFRMEELPMKEAVENCTDNNREQLNRLVTALQSGEALQCMTTPGVL